jgi:hypothetical protein
VTLSVVGVAIAMPVGVEGGGRPRGVVMNSEFHSPSIIHQFYAPESVLWVAPPSEDGLSVEGDFTPVLMEEDFAARVTEDGDQEEFVDEAGQLVGEACVVG